MTEIKRRKVLFLLNQLRAGTGPFQRGIRLDDEVFDITILSCYDTTEEAQKTARLLRDDFGNRRVQGLGEKNKLMLAVALLKYLKSNRPHIIQTAHTYSTLLAILFARVLGHSIVINFEGTLFKSIGPVRRFLLQFALSFTNGTICVSNAVKEANSFSENLLRHHMERRVIYNGVDHAEIDKVKSSAIRLPGGYGETPFVIGFVGDLKPVKDIPTLIDAFISVVHDIPEAILIIVGGGPLENQLRDQARSGAVSDRIIFTGQIERSEVYGVLNLMQIFVMPSLIEGLSESIVQAMAKGLPIVASNIEPNRELIQQDVNGCLFPVGNSRLLRDAIVKLYRNDGLRNEMSRLNRDYSEQKLDIFEITRQYEKFYYDLLNRGHVYDG